MIRNGHVTDQEMTMTKTDGMYPGPFWIQRRDTNQFLIVNGSDYSYTLRKSGATEFAKWETASGKFDKLGLDTATHCIVPSRDIG